MRNRSVIVVLSSAPDHATGRGGIAGGAVHTEAGIIVAESAGVSDRALVPRYVFPELAVRSRVSRSVGIGVRVTQYFPILRCPSFLLLLFVVGDVMCKTTAEGCQLFPFFTLTPPYVSLAFGASDKGRPVMRKR